jgi:CspA family cold shock protein
MAQEGTVKWLSQDKGYGSITPDDGGEDVFVHFSAIAGSGFRNVEEGERATYEVGQGRKGLQAVNVSEAYAGTAPTGPGSNSLGSGPSSCPYSTISTNLRVDGYSDDRCLER